VDFEEEQAAAGPLGIPWPVWVAVDGLSRQLLFGQQRLPKVKAFCYGNEVHYFLGYRNHPLFLRVDFAPPLRGGMLDLEFFGVSKHELDSHPNPSLDGVGRFFRRLDVEVQIENTRIHARYDKERAADLSDLCEKVEALFRLAPYLMDIDWTIGDLALDAGTRARVSEAWADFFARWGVLPVEQLLTSDRVGILAAVEADPSGPREVRWDGQGPYRDRFAAVPGVELWRAFRAALERRGLPGLVPGEEGPASQLDLERELLRPLRDGVARGEWREMTDGLAPAPPDLFERRHETGWFAELLAGDGTRVAASARVARLASALERHLRFETTGSVNGYEVQRAELPLRGEAITLFVLRDDAGVFRLALFTLDGPLYRRRSAPGRSWHDNAILDTEILNARLRRNNLPVSWGEPAGPEEAEALRTAFLTPNPHEEPPHLPGERVIRGIAAAPGVATGLACLGVAGRAPADVDGAILIAASVRPEDGPLLLGSAGVVSTGGGVLSHAGLLAMQYGKPALVTGGRWEETPGAAPTVICRRTEFEEAVALAGPLRVVE
ncbi:MAG TPA: PEP-utilizing enzyme, partial [Thermoanaerobaculia bacterium]